jgi:uncharacterized protein YjiS (DUF1127 family)
MTSIHGASSSLDTLRATPTGWSRALVRAVRLFVAWRNCVAERRQVRSLLALDDSLLRDIGVTRSELQFRASCAFWNSQALGAGPVLPRASSDTASAVSGSLASPRIVANGNAAPGTRARARARS